MPVERIRPRNGNVEGGGIDGGRRDALKENKRPKEMLTTRQVANNVECSAQLMHYLLQERCKRKPLHQAKVRNCKVFRAKQPNRIHSNPTQLILTQLYSTHPNGTESEGFERTQPRLAQHNTTQKAKR